MANKVEAGFTLIGLMDGTTLNGFLRVEGNPVKDAYSLSLAEGDPDGRMSWDQTAVLVAIKGYEPYYRVERGSIHLIDDEGSNRWIPDEKGRDFRLIEKVPAKEMATLIENYMMHQPISK